MLSSPALDSAGRVCFGSDDNNFYILQSSGSLVWSFATSGAVQSSPGLSSDGKVFFGSGDSNVYAVNSALTPTPTPTPIPTPYVHYVELEVLPNQGKTEYQPGDKVVLAWEVYIDDYSYRGVPVDVYLAALINPPCTPVPRPRRAERPRAP